MIEETISSMEKKLNLKIENLILNIKLSVPSIAKILGVSKTHLYNEIKKR